jgi:tetratricopeptide (TPR) repeat protein
MARLAPDLDVSDLAAAAFVDVETTGLAGGTGTYVFLVGIGTFEHDAFRLRQFFLADLAGEAAMLAAIAELLAGCGVVVSFNGRRFDLPLIQTRLAMCRTPSTLGDLAHIDLLYPARRLYRHRLPSCRLAALEEAALGFHREDDLPGWDIPAIYFDYLRRGAAGALAAVFHHNALDILSLAALLAHLGGRLADVSPRDSGYCLALARWDEAAGRLDDAALLYEAALQTGSTVEDRCLAYRGAVRTYRRLGRYDDLVRVSRNRSRQSKSAAGQLEALVALAKVEEHRHRDYAEAEALTRRALALVDVTELRRPAIRNPSHSREALQHRLRRLRRRLAAAGGRRVPGSATAGASRS